MSDLMSDALHGDPYGDAELDLQVERLARFIMDEVPGEPSQNQGAIDTAIRLLRTCVNDHKSTEGAVAIVAGMLSTIDFLPSMEHPEKMVPMARLIVDALKPGTEGWW